MKGAWQRRGAASACAILAVLSAASGCRRAQGASAPNVQAEATGADAGPSVPFELRADSTDVTFFWFDQWGNAHAVSRADEVPTPSRERVRVDPVRPELRAAGWVYVADVRAAGPDGRYPVRAVLAEAFAAELDPALAARTQQAAARGDGGPANAEPEVVLYGASWCGACQQAKQWMRQQGIPFVEHDIEREPQAAQELTARAREQGVPTGSIPIISVRGRLTVGFDPGTITRGLGRS
jgi:glutaredoxin